MFLIKHMKKILIFPFSNQLGTIIPSITIGNLLKKNNYHVVFACNGKYTQILLEKGFEVVSIDEVSYTYYRENVDHNSMQFYSKELVRFMVDAEVQLIQKENPDLIIGHNRPTLYISSKLARKKYINITVASLTNFYDFEYFAPNNHPLNKYFPIGDINRLLPARLRKFIFKLTMKSWVKGFNQTLKYFKIPEVKDFLELNNADIVLLCETYGLVAVKDLPDNYFFLEQDVNSGFGESHSWINKIKELKLQGKKIIFVSMGSSSFNAYPLVIDSIINFFQQKKDKYVLVSNHCGIEKDFKTTPTIFIEQYINPSEMLPYADLVITHGGKNTLNECILHKKPVIGIPEQGEQLWNLKYIEHLGGGKIIFQEDLQRSPEILVKTIEKILSDKDFINNLNKFVENSLEKRDIIDHKESIMSAINKLIS